MPPMAPVYEQEAPLRRMHSTWYGTRTQPRTCEVGTQTDSSSDSHWRHRALRSQASSVTAYRELAIPPRPWCYGGVLPGHVDPELRQRKSKRVPELGEGRRRRQEPAPRVERRNYMSSTETAKLLKDLDKFSGKNGEDAEEFLEDVETWTDFKFRFRRMFICDLRSRTQAETITPYLLSLCHIVRPQSARAGHVATTVGIWATRRRSARIREPNVPRTSWHRCSAHTLHGRSRASCAIVRE